MHYNTVTRQALLLKGREFMRARRAFVEDGNSLPSIIMACIEDGVVTRNDIVRTVPKFVGHSYRDVAWTLDRLTGPSPETHICFRDESQTYRLHQMPSTDSVPA